MATTKSKAALSYNVELLAQKGQLYFWTFTLPVKLHPVEGAKMWGDLNRELRRSVGFYGLRVFELHPGGHGLHVHVATSDIFDIREIIPICKRLGWGKVFVCEWDDDIEQAGRYMSKYLTKQVQMWQGMGLKGVRWWASFGKCGNKPIDHVRVKDVEIQSFRRAIWDAVPSWIVAHIMGVSGPDDLACETGARLSKKALTEAKMMFRIKVAMGKCALSDYTKKVHVLPKFVNAQRSFNYCKMWLCTKIYMGNENLMECFNGCREWGLRARALGYDFVELRRGAAFVSGLRLGGACASGNVVDDFQAFDMAIA